MKPYTIENLNHIYIRAKNKIGRWSSLSLSQVSDKHFVDWITRKFNFEIKDAPDQVGKPWTPEQKINLLNYISKNIGKPCVVMFNPREIKDDKNGKPVENIGEVS